jgi:hypothetical protein
MERLVPSTNPSDGLFQAQLISYGQNMEGLKSWFERFQIFKVSTFLISPMKDRVDG